MLSLKKNPVKELQSEFGYKKTRRGRTALKEILPFGTFPQRNARYVGRVQYCYLSSNWPKTPRILPKVKRLIFSTFGATSCACCGCLWEFRHPRHTSHVLITRNK